MSTLTRCLHGLADLLYPPRCVACGAWGAWLCPVCLATIPWLQPPLCRHCGRPVAVPGLCRRCRGGHSALESIHSVAPHHPPLREAVHAFKYEGLRALAPTLGDLLERCRQEQHVGGAFIIAVPLHPARLRRRGYNQSLLLARELARRSGIPLGEGMLWRVRDTPSQVGLSRSLRLENVRDAFGADAGPAVGREIILVDDVFTTGATLEACAAALRLAGVRTVRALTLARAVDPRGRAAAGPD